MPALEDPLGLDTAEDPLGLGSGIGVSPVSDSDPLGLQTPGEVGGTVNEFKRGLLSGQQQIIASELATTPRRPTILQQRQAFVRGMSDPRYQEALTQAGDDPAKLARVEAALGPAAQSSRLTTGLDTRRQFLAEDIADLERQQQEIHQSEAMAEWSAADNSNWWKVLAKNPVEIAAGITAQSLPAMAPGMALNVVAPGGRIGKAAGTGIGSASVEAANAYLDSARQTGYEFTDPDKVREFFENPQAQAKARTFAAQRGVPIGVFDALTAGLAGKFIGPALRQSAGKVIAGAGKEMTSQAAGGMAGELAGQLTTGQPISVKEIVAEGIGEMASAPQEVISNLRDRRNLLQREPPASPVTVTPEPPPTTTPPAYDEFGATPSPGGEGRGEGERSTETTAQQFAREQREASAAMARLRAEEAAIAQAHPLTDSPTHPPTAVSESVSKPVSGTATVPVTEDHLQQAREAMAGERPPDILDDVEGVTSSPVLFPQADFADTFNNAVQGTLSQAGRPTARTKRFQRRVSLTEGEQADKVLQALAAENPKYADWTADDLAQAMIRATAAREGTGQDSPAVIQLAQEIAQAERSAPVPGAAATEDPLGIEQPFSLAPSTPQAQAQADTTRQLAGQGAGVRVFHNPNALVNGQLVEATVDPDGTIALNSAAPGMQNPAYVRAKVRHEATHNELATPAGQTQLSRLAGKLTSQQKAELQRLGYVQPPGLSAEAYDRWLTNEFIARQAENNTAWWKRYVQHVADWLRGKKGFRDITNEEVARAILRKLNSQRAAQAQSQPQAAPTNYSLAAPQTDTRRLTRQIDASNLSPEAKAALTNRIYNVANIPAARAVAADLVQAIGLDKSAEAVLDISIPLPGSVRSQLMQTVARGMAQQSPQAYGDFMNRAINLTTDAGQFIAHLKGWAESTPEGAVATAQRILEGVADKVLASYEHLLGNARQALAQAHRAATTETIQSADIQSDASAAVDEAVQNDPEVQKAVRTEAGQSLVNDEEIRRRAQAALPPGSDITDVLNVVLDHFRFEGQSMAVPLNQKLINAGVPTNYAEGFARSLEAAWTKKVDSINGSLPKHLRNLRLSKEVIGLAENIVRGLETKATSARARLAAKFKPASGTFSLAQPTGPNAETISDLADVGAAMLGRESLNFAEWSARITAEYGPGVQPFLEAAYPLAQQRMAAEAGKQRPGQGGRPRKAGETPALPDTELNRLLRAKLKQWQTTLAQAVNKPQMGRKLGDAIVLDSKLTGPAAEKLRAALNCRFEALATQRKQKALDRLMKGQPDSKPVKSIQAALRKLVDLHNAGALDDAKFADAVKQALGLKTLTPDESTKLRQLAQDLQAIPEDQEQRRQQAAVKLAHQLARLRPGHWWDLPMGLWYAHILSGPTTHIVNAASNALNLAGTLAAVTVRNPARLQQIIPQLARGTRQAIPEMLHALTEGSVTGPRLGDKFNDPGVWSRFDSRWLLPWKLVGRALAAGDLLFFYPAYQVQQGLLARAIARGENFSGRALNRRVAEILGNTDAARSAAALQATQEGYTGPKHRSRVEEIIQQQRDATAEFNETGREFALRTTFNNQPYGLLGAAARAINAVGAQFPAVRLVIPFTNIIANVTNESLNYTPIGSLRALAARYGGANLYGKSPDITAWADKEAMADLHAKAALGTLLLGALVLKAASHADDDDPPFAINGQGPSDANKRKTWEAAGNLRNSIRFGGRSYSFQNTPLAVPLAVIGNMLDAHKYGKLDDTSILDRTALALSMSARSIVQQSFLDSLARLMGALEHPSPRNAARNLADWAGRTGSSLVVPNAVRQVEQLFDPKKYDDYTVQGELLRHIPFVRANNRPTLNGLGEPITRPLSDRFTKPENPDPLWRELARLNVGVYPTNLEWQGERLTEDQLYEITRVSGPKIRKDLEKLMSGSSYNRWNEETKLKAFDKMIQARHKEAKMKAVSAKVNTP
jgi:hypothetical protein